MPDPVGLLSTPDEPSGPGYWAQTASNIVPSAKGLLGDMYSMVRHPIQTVQGILGLGHSLVNLAIPGEQGNEELAKAVGEYFADRYGGVENLQRTLRDDPVGLSADITMLIGGGAGIAAKTGGKAGQLAAAVQRAARTVDPANLVVQGARGTAQAAAQATARGGAAMGNKLAEVAGVPSGVGRLPLEAAYAAGKKGGDDLKNLLDAMRGRRPQDAIDIDIVNRANAALSALGEARRAAYNRGMGALSSTAVDLTPLKQTIKGLYDQWRVGPNRTLRKDQPGVKRLEEIERKIKEFEDLGATSAPDLDALKREIDALMGEAGTGAGRSANAVTSTVRNELRAEIIRVDPEYKAIMEGYEAALKLERELMKDLSLSQTSTDQAALRKLIQSLRDGVNTNMGGRAGQVAGLDPQLTNLIAGRTLAPAVPHGMAKWLGPVGAAGAGTYMAGPKGLAALLTASPRAMGEGAVMAGQMAGRMGGMGARYPQLGQVASRAVPAANMALNATRTALPVQRALNDTRGLDPSLLQNPAPQMTPRPSEGLTEEEIERRFNELLGRR